MFSRTTLLIVTAAFLPVLPRSAPAAEVLFIDLGGMASINSAAHPANAVLITNLPFGEQLQSVDFDIRGVVNPLDVGDIAPFGGSWVSEVRIRVISSDGQVLIEHRPYSPAYDYPNTSDPADLPGNFSGTFGLPWTVPTGGGSIQIELYESLDDNPARADGYYAAGSGIRLTVAGYVIPEPGAPLLILLGLLLGFQRIGSRGDSRASGAPAPTFT